MQITHTVSDIGQPMTAHITTSLFLYAKEQRSQALNALLQVTQSLNGESEICEK